MASGSMFATERPPTYQKEFDRILQRGMGDLWDNIPQKLSAVGVLDAVTCTLDRI